MAWSQGLSMLDGMEMNCGWRKLIQLGYILYSVRG